MAAGAELDRDLPCFFLPLGNKGASGSLDLKREVRVPVFDGAVAQVVDTGSMDMTAKDQFSIMRRRLPAIKLT